MREWSHTGITPFLYHKLFDFDFYLGCPGTLMLGLYRWKFSWTEEDFPRYKYLDRERRRSEKYSPVNVQILPIRIQCCNLRSIRKPLGILVTANSQQLTKCQINPHFLTQSLCCITSSYFVLNRKTSKGYVVICTGFISQQFLVVKNVTLILSRDYN